ncbi:hypothetical protein T492DRAFT_882204 [Pavlovales sp. CCMP2436]|nr:hypothetical protein T492DRAFT_882204 [Pavlovales sp. CCMP2436]
MAGLSLPAPAIMPPKPRSCIEIYVAADDVFRAGIVETVDALRASMSVSFRDSQSREVGIASGVWRVEGAGEGALASLKVGSQLSVYWPGEGKCFSGRVQRFDEARRLWLVGYDDGDSLILRLLSR